MEDFEYKEKEKDLYELIQPHFAHNSVQVVYRVIEEQYRIFVRLHPNKKILEKDILATIDKCFRTLFEGRKACYKLFLISRSNETKTEYVGFTQLDL